MGARLSSLEDTVGGALQRLLMPAQVPDWYAQQEGGGPSEAFSFPATPATSLSLLGSASLCVGSLEEARAFYEGCLGGVATAEASALMASVELGSTQLALRLGVEGAWPAHCYAWAADLAVLHAACEQLGKTLNKLIVVDLKWTADGTSLAALVLQDPSGSSTFAVNKAPAGFPDRFAILQMTYTVPPGSVGQLAKFYSQMLSAAVEEEQEAAPTCKVFLSAGSALSQTLIFVEEGASEGGAPLSQPKTSAVAPADEEAPRQRASASVCVYVRSADHFRAAFKKCLAAGLVLSEGGTTRAEEEAAVKTGEFRARGCIAKPGMVLVDVEHAVRWSTHPGFPLKASAPSVKAVVGAVDSQVVFREEDVAQHNTPEDAWVALNGKVFDVTTWINAHPGGKPILLSKAGTDVSTEWNTMHAQDVLARALMHPLGPKLVGTLANGEQSNDSTRLNEGAFGA